jgi:predicted DNA-binding protein with PD1-like motif
MKSRQIDQSPKTFILVFETGDELAKGLLVANQESISAASFKAVGALWSLRLGLSDYGRVARDSPGTTSEMAGCHSREPVTS